MDIGDHYKERIGWFGCVATKNVYLATLRGGRHYIMDFVRWGMHGAAPRFQRDIGNGDGVMCRVDELVDADHNSMFTQIDNPDARRLVACWDACIGIPTELLERDGMALLAQARAQIIRRNGEEDPAREGVEESPQDVQERS